MLTFTVRAAEDETPEPTPDPSPETTPEPTSSPEPEPVAPLMVDPETCTVETPCVVSDPVALERLDFVLVGIALALLLLTAVVFAQLRRP